ncbi:DUF4157 domain-containing protein [Dechloromonas sp.]|uniref:eCIS core domain-containing protein n=1 Tax=Dechloromonas sp. TaxID=1917218 RepID=UPI00286D7559|nr:DUF4157 domain-containing protein [Dechloromonas sp.]
MSQLARPVAAPSATVVRPATSARLALQPDKSVVTAPHEAAPALSASGQPLPNALRQEFEPFFAHDLSRVRIHVDQPARQLANGLGADAFAMGNAIGFAANRFRPDTVGGRRLLAHELAHVVQQGAIPTVNGKNRPKTLPQAAERQADSAALAYLTGRPGPALSRFQPGLACAVKTNGGEFDTDRYTPTNVPPRRGGTVGKVIGASIRLHFTPNDLVEADLIGTVQTVRTLRNTRAGGAINATSFPTPHKGTLALGRTESDPGRVIDQTDTGTRRTPNTNPLYATDAKPGAIPTKLTDAVPAPETVGAGAGYGKDTFGEHGHRKKKADGTFEVKKATLSDSPSRSIEFARQEWVQTFEVSALALSGPLANTYLGSVEWGWKCDAAGTATLDPPAIRLISPGLPSSAFADAAKKWNAGKTVRNPATRRPLDTIDLPLPTSATETSNKPAVERGTGEMLLALDTVNTTLKTATDVDKNAKTLEKRAMEQTLSTRQVLVNVNVKKTEDWTGADEVYAQLKSGNKQAKTPVKSLNDGQSGSFALPLPSLMPIKGPISVQIYDEDTGTFFDRDDLIVHMLWQPPYGGIRNTRSRDEADYDVVVRFNK